jgi:hypothetical protein
MAYVLDAFIGPAETFAKQVLQLPNTKLVLLEQGMAMAPMKYAIPHLKAIKPLWHLTSELFQLGSQLSALGPIGYFEIELFGGYGERAAVLWENQEIVYGPVFSEHSSTVTNHLLSLLGVHTAESDEFDALQLAKYRHSEDWLK